MAHRAAMPPLAALRNAGGLPDRCLFESYHWLLQMLESFWLASGSYLAGDDISIADLYLVTELDMLQMLAGATEVSHLSGVFLGKQCCY